jgi:acyl transferase domain-containing protein
MENGISANESVAQNGNGAELNDPLSPHNQKCPQKEVHNGSIAKQPDLALGLTDGSDPTANGRAFTPIAICGMACRLPGNIHNTQDLWHFLMSKSDARSVVPPTRYNISGYYSSIKKPGAAISEYGYFLDESVDLSALDTSFFSMSRGEAEQLDPQQRLLLEVARECLDDSGEVAWKGKGVGVYVGSFGNDWYDVTQTESQRYGIYQVSTTHDFALSNRLSYEMDLRGPRYEILSAESLCRFTRSNY